MIDKIKIRRVLLSVSDKAQLLSLAKTLVEMGCELISTGGTRQLLLNAGLPTTEISTVTGNPEAFGGRMKTISFAIESALLYDRERDAAEADALNIAPIDMVVCNLYPFEQVRAAHADFETLIENIDIGGPTMVRSAAKNFKWVTVVTDIVDYAAIIAELKQQQGYISYATRRQLMRKAFNHTADYDSCIAQAMDKEDQVLSLRLAFTEGKPLRYGENSHQTARYYRDLSADYSLSDMQILHGKALSFNNLLDINSAVSAVNTLSQYACAVVKHNNTCGVAIAPTAQQALTCAWAGDPMSAFGSIIACNYAVDLSTVQFFNLDATDRQLRKFVEVIIAPSFSLDALAYLQQHKDLRIIQYDISRHPNSVDRRYCGGILLEQDADNQMYTDLENKTKLQIPIVQNEALIQFGLHTIAQIKSNAIVVVRQLADHTLQLLGMGAGQPNRLVATKLAIEKCRENLSLECQGFTNEQTETYIAEQLSRAILISDAFFPFEDNIELAAAAGIRQIVQPGGSIRDKHIIAASDRLNVAMIFSGLRHFKH